MAMRIFRARFLPLAILALPATPVAAQVDDGIVLEILRQCARIDDATARLACYDNNVRVGGESAPSRRAVPGEMSAPQSSLPPAVASGPAGFGREDVRTPDRFQSPAGEVEEISARVQAVSQQTQGVYLITLEDGAQWLFSETVDFSYRPPRAGSTVQIDRAALGSFLMVFDRQPSVRVRRIR